MKGVLFSVYPSLLLTLTETMITFQHFTIMSSAKKKTQLTAVLEKSMITSSVISSMSPSEFLPQNVNRLVSRALTLATGCEFMRVEQFSISEIMIWNIFFFLICHQFDKKEQNFSKGLR